MDIYEDFSRIDVKTEGEFFGTFKGYEVSVERNTDGFYIHVFNSEISFGTSYDGV